MIDVQVREQDEVEILQLRTRFAEAQRGAASSIDQQARFAIAPDQVAAAGALVLNFRSTRAEHLKFHPFSRASRFGMGELDERYRQKSSGNGSSASWSAKSHAFPLSWSARRVRDFTRRGRRSQLRWSPWHPGRSRCAAPEAHRGSES